MSEVTAVPLRPIKKSALTALGVGIGLLVAAGVGVAYAGTDKQVRMAMPPAEFLAHNAKRSGVVALPSGLQYQVLKEGHGAKAADGDLALVDYDGKFVSGESFDSSARNGGPVPMPVGGGLIPGFVEGLKQMNEGAKYRFWIPPELAYGTAGAGGGKIPPNSLLIFDITVQAIQRGGMAAMGGMGMGGGASPHGQ